MTVTFEECTHRASTSLKSLIAVVKCRKVAKKEKTCINFILKRVSTTDSFTCIELLRWFAAQTKKRNNLT